jgi:hypothetical protein
LILGEFLVGRQVDGMSTRFIKPLSWGVNVLRTAILVAAIALAAASGVRAEATYVYSAAPAVLYPDAAGTKLTDGVVGNAGWNNPVGPWIGWEYTSTVSIDFDFGAQQHFSAVSVGSTQDSTYGLLALPNLVVSSWNGSSWVQQGNLNTPFDVANDKYYQSTDPHAWLTLSGLSFDAEKIRVTLNSNGQVSNGQKWTFVDEVRFTATPVPEASTPAMSLAGLGLLWLLARARRSSLGGA